MHQSLCIIILNWNSVDDSLSAIESLKDSPWDICVVDNASTDDHEVVRIHSEFPQVHVVKTGRNLGYAGGMNTGMKWALSRAYSHVLLLNPDTTPSRDVIEAMLGLAHGAAVVGTAQVTEDRLPYVSAANLYGKRVVPFQCSESCGIGHDVDIVSGAGILVDLSFAELVGFIDENFFHYKEEFDFCYRVHSSGGIVRYNCGTPLIHRRGGSLSGSSPDAMYYSYRNELLFLRKHFGILHCLSALGLYRKAIMAMAKAPNNRPSILRGLIHGVMGVSGPLNARAKTGSSR